jgi:serine-type D-Ala-D-Ala carboxypeptidase/endopeptidase
MTNSANVEFIFKELLEILIGDIFTPWKWQEYFPLGHKKQNNNLNP